MVEPRGVKKMAQVGQGQQAPVCNFAEDALKQVTRRKISTSAGK
jgi:hypothetical protein